MECSLLNLARSALRLILGKFTTRSDRIIDMEMPQQTHNRRDPDKMPPDKMPLYMYAVFS